MIEKVIQHEYFYFRFQWKSDLERTTNSSSRKAELLFHRFLGACKRLIVSFLEILVLYLLAIGLVCSVAYLHNGIIAILYPLKHFSLQDDCGGTRE